MNTDHPNQMMPYFRDKFGTLCAVADLVDQTAGPDMVNYFVTKDNTFLVNETNDPVLNLWSDEQGLTTEERALIQPM